MNTKRLMKSSGRLLVAFYLIIACIGTPAPASCPIDKEYKEALQQTEDEFNAFRETLQQGSGKLEEFEGKYQEYEDIIFSQDMEKGIKLACEIFGCDPKDRATAKKYLSDMRETFNTLDKGGVKSKMKLAARRMKKADKVAGEVEGAYEFAKKFDPENAKENPTYGLRLIGDILTESADKMNKIPLVGRILGDWLKAYGEVAGDFANALDRLSAKIKVFRQGALCAQSGLLMEEQNAFRKAQQDGGAYGGQDCLTYFAVDKFQRLRGSVFEGQGNYFLFDPETCRGYFSPIGNTDLVYDWHAMLVKPRRLTADWLSNRARSLNDQLIQEARSNASLIIGLGDQTNKGWVIIEALKLFSRIQYFASLGEDVIVANDVIDKDIHDEILQIVSKYNEYVYASGTVNGSEGGEKKPLAGASVVFNLAGKNFSASTNQEGQYELLMKGEVGASVEISVSKEGFDTYKTSGKMPEKVVLGYDFSLEKPVSSFTIMGTIFDKSTTPPKPISGATVTASGPGKTEAGETASGADGSYTVTLTAPPNSLVSVTATKEGSSGSNQTVASGMAKSGIDIFLEVKQGADTTTVLGWTITVTVIDISGNPLSGAVVSGGPAAVTSDAAGVAVIGPIPLTSQKSDEPVSVTLTASIVTQDGTTIAGGSETVTYAGELASAATLSIPVLLPVEVTVSGIVTDANGVAVEGAAVVSGTASTATSVSGQYTIGPVKMVANQAITINATKSEGKNSYGGTPVTVTCDGKSKIATAPAIVLSIMQLQEVIISGRVIGADRKPLNGAAVRCAGVSTTTDAGGEYTLPAVRLELGKPVEVTGSIAMFNGDVASGSTSVTPNSPTAGGALITLQVNSVPADSVQFGNSIDSALNDMANDTTTSLDAVQARMEFDFLVAQMEGMANNFYGYADNFDQRLRELGMEACKNQSVAYSLSTSEKILERSREIMVEINRTYGIFKAAFDANPFDPAFLTGAADYGLSQNRLAAMDGRYQKMLGDFGLYQCDKNATDVNAGDVAQDDADPDDVETGANAGGGVEVCGDGIDNDGDNLIDECDAGCCDKNVQLTVTDCGTAPDDIFLVAIDGMEVGVTPKGNANTFNVELSPGGHSVTVTCLDDGGEPGVADDIGTACATLVIYGTQTDIGGGELAIGLAATQDIGFTVPASANPPALNKVYDGRTLVGLESSR